jgi:hypothetical protein
MKRSIRIAAALLFSCIRTSFAISQISDARISQLTSATRILARQRALEEFVSECKRLEIPKLSIKVDAALSSWRRENAAVLSRAANVLEEDWPWDVRERTRTTLDKLASDAKPMLQRMPAEQRLASCDQFPSALEPLAESPDYRVLMAQ